MKKVLFATLLSSLFLNTSAQLRVDSIGKVTIGTVGTTDMVLRTNGGLHATRFDSAHTSDSIAIHNGSLMQKTAICGQAISPAQTGQFSTCGVKGIAGLGNGGFNYGVAGMLSSTGNGAAIYGSTSTTYQYKDIVQRYAGYFDGDVQITSDLYIDGRIAMLTPAGPYPGGFNTLGEETFLSERLSAVDVTTTCMETENHESTSLSPIAEEGERLQYGLGVESLCKQFPELVFEDKDGRLMIDYMQMIPILIKCVTEMSKRIEELESGSGQPKRIAPISSAINEAPATLENGAAYDLSGRRVSNATGQPVILQNGKKYHITD